MFDDVLAGNGTRTIKAPVRSPRANSFAERYAGTLRPECLDHLLVYGERHLRPIVDQGLLDGQHRNPDPVGRPEFLTTAYFHTPDGRADEIERAGFTGTAVYGVSARAGRFARRRQTHSGASRSC